MHQLQFTILKNQVSLYLDTSGEGLHKRGYRRNANLAPIRETLAAGILDLGRMRSNTIVCDPFCGSGTFLIEAARRACKIAPGLDRRFQAEQWDSIPAQVWRDARAEALDRIPVAGSRIAERLKRAKDGIKGFYDSEFTDKMVSHIQSLGGVLTHEDFAQYKSVMRDPLSTTYNGYTVYTTGGPSNGGVALLEALNILEHFDLKSYGFDSPETVQIMADAYAMAYQDGVSFMGDPDYYDLPVETIISKEYAEERAKAITPGERIKTAKAGRLTVTLSETGQKVLDDCTPDQGGTTHLVCADKFGNVVSTTNTNGINFGSAVAVPGTGFVFSAHLGNLNNSTSARVNMVMPYIRVRSTTCPTIVAGPDGKPVLAIGSPGNWALVSAAIEGVVNYATFGMSLGNVINSPRSYRDGISKNLTIESGYSEETIKKLEEMGFVLEDYDKDFSSHVGSLAGIQINSDGSFWALGDFRRNYGASAY